MSDAPERIYLQLIHEDDWAAATWCADQIEHDDVEYVRADRITALEAENKALREGLEFYAGPENYVGRGDLLTMDFIIFEDCGDRARALLAKEKTD